MGKSNITLYLIQGNCTCSFCIVVPTDLLC